MTLKERSAHPQCATVLRHLKEYGSISPAEAKEVYGVSRLAARILDLREDGVAIEATLKTDPAGKRYARYRLSKGVCP